MIVNRCRNNGNALEKGLKQSVNVLCDESSAQLQECLTVNRITNARAIKLVRKSAARLVSQW